MDQLCVNPRPQSTSMRDDDVAKKADVLVAETSVDAAVAVARCDVVAQWAQVPQNMTWHVCDVKTALEEYSSMRKWANELSRTLLLKPIESCCGPRSLLLSSFLETRHFEVMREDVSKEEEAAAVAVAVVVPTEGDMWR